MVDSHPGSPSGSAALVEEFLPLNRRRTRGDPPLSVAELERWMELRWLLEHALNGSSPIDDHGRPLRRTFRVPTHLKVRATRGSTIDVVSCQDISDGGLFLVTRRPLAPGTPLHLEIEGITGDPPIAVDGTVTWVRPGSDESGPGGMGIRFDHPDEEQHPYRGSLSSQSGSIPRRNGESARRNRQIPRRAPGPKLRSARSAMVRT